MPEGIIKFSVKFRFSHDLLHTFPQVFFQRANKNEPDSDIYVRKCGYHCNKYIGLIVMFSTEKVMHSQLK